MLVISDLVEADATVCLLRCFGFSVLHLSVTCYELCDITSSDFISKDCVGIRKTKLTTHIFLLYITTFHILFWCLSPFSSPPLFLLKKGQILLCLVDFANHHFVQNLVLLKFWMQKKLQFPRYCHLGSGQLFLWPEGSCVVLERQEW